MLWREPSSDLEAWPGHGGHGGLRTGDSGSPPDRVVVLSAVFWKEDTGVCGSQSQEV